MHRSKTSASRPAHSETLDGLAHDARNVLTGLMLYCELLSMPGILNENHGHYAHDLESIVTRAGRMLERIVETASAAQPLPASASANLPAAPLTDAAEELRHAQPLLAAIAGPAIKLSIATMPCAGQTALTVEDLTRILVNLVRNAADAMPSGGHIRITAQYGDRADIAASHVLLTVTDDGPGIPESLRAHIFDLGFTTRNQPRRSGSRVVVSQSRDSQTQLDDASFVSGHGFSRAANASELNGALAPEPIFPSQPHWPSPRRRGLGLSIVRNLVEAAGGSVLVHSAPGAGARFEIRLPLVSPDSTQVTSGTCATQSQNGISADARGKGCIECE